MRGHTLSFLVDGSDLKHQAALTSGSIIHINRHLDRRFHAKWRAGGSCGAICMVFTLVIISRNRGKFCNTIMNSPCKRLAAEYNGNHEEMSLQMVSEDLNVV
jgi:hypothetical protein